MRRLLSLFAIITLTSSMYSQELDSLQVLSNKDWYTLQWLEKDTVYLIPKTKINTDYDGLTSSERLRKKRKSELGERISFKSGELKYTDYAICKVGEPLRLITSFIFENNKVFIEYQTKPWPWKGVEWVFKKRKYEILKWSDEGIVLR